MGFLRGAVLALGLGVLAVDAEDFVAEGTELSVDDTCTPGDEDCTLSLRQLRSTAKKMQEVRAHAQEETGSEAVRQLLTKRLLSRASGSGADAETTLDKGLQCKTVRDGLYRTVIYGLFSKADHNGDGEVQLKDVADLVPDIDEAAQHRLTALFEAADQDGSRSLSQDEMVSAAEKLAQPLTEGDALSDEEHDTRALASLLARAGEQGKATSLDSTIYCKRRYYVPGGPFGPYLEQDAAAGAREEPEPQAPQVVSSEGEAYHALLTSLVQRAAGGGEAEATTLDQGLRCKTVFDGQYRTVIYGLYSEADRNGDGEVQMKEVASLAPGLGEEGRGNLQALFEVADEDGSRGLSKEELSTVMDRLEHPPQVADEARPSGSVASLLARAGEQGAATSLDSTVYCKRDYRYGFDFYR